MLKRSWPAFVFTVLTSSLCHSQDSIEQSFRVIARVGDNGAGSAEARRARDALAAGDAELLPKLLEAMDTPNVIAANWYRTVYDKIVARELAKPKEARELPVDLLKEFVGDSERHGRVRRLALNFLEQQEPGFRERLLLKLIDDPEFRDEAVTLALQQGDSAKNSGDAAEARAAYQTAFAHARDSGQITQLAGKLKALDVEVDIVRHMGFVTRWYLLGPFDAPEMTGFDHAFPPEKDASRINLQAEAVGKDGETIGWRLYETADTLGQLNLIQAIAPVKEAVGYAYTELESPREQPAELRCGADDNLTVWLNGEKVFSRRQWLNGTRLDRFTAEVKLQSGKNRVLVKVCQGPQHKNPAVPNNWSMQLRFCDKTGRGAELESLLPLPPPQNR
jgi:hypothetical protein